MYFPYLRGRQFELLAIRELVNNSLIGEHVFPIIEPVHLTSTLVKTLEICKAKGYKLGLVMNPQVGNFTNDLKDSSNSVLLKRYQDFICSAGDAIVPVYILNDSNMNPFDKLPDLGGKFITVCETSDALQFFTKLSYEERASICYNLIPDESRFRRGTRAYNNVVFEDYFHKQDKNADYGKPNVVDEPYTDEYKFYASDGFKGFGDYSIVGKTYNDSGFAPYAVAIHIIYPANEELRIHHFVSDSNDDITDVAGKFGEAVKKLDMWYQSQDKKRIDTCGMREFEQLYATKSFPGLGVVKKLSIMHHLELMEKLGEEDNSK
ncbi:sce7725 family protein [Dialister succinatiphilus]|jgi:hypothetical protein|uniref:sce7725 family protein n=1 Tax=Dialister succinatiphilus TaxID=487173 RepID=UPI0023521956|nr:sce7725 family protein [Dialister succinatiphilus]